MSSALFTPAGEGRWLPSERTRGPWDPAAQHGGAPAALVGALVEAAEPGSELRVARVAFELVRPVPLTELHADVEVVRPGRRAQVVEARLHADGKLVLRATAVRLRRAPGVSPAVGLDDPPPPGPEHGRQMPFAVAADASLETFATHGFDIRFVEGSYLQPGPSIAWFRLRGPVIDGREPSPLQRVLAAADFGNGISSVLDWSEHVFINPDLTVHLEREPEGEWIALDARTRIAPDGTGVAESVLSDERGRVGRAVQALLVDRRG